MEECDTKHRPVMRLLAGEMGGGNIVGPEWCSLYEYETPETADMPNGIAVVSKGRVAEDSHEDFVRETGYGNTLRITQGLQSGDMCF